MLPDNLHPKQRLIQSQCFLMLPENLSQMTFIVIVEIIQTILNVIK